MSNNSIFLKNDIKELREWTRLILGDAEIQDQIESGEMAVEERDNFISGKQAREAEIHIGKQIIKALQIKISEWQAAKEKLLS